MQLKRIISPFILVALILFSWEHLIVLLDMPVSFLMLMVCGAAASLWANSMILCRVAQRYRRDVTISSALWMSSLGVLGNSLGLPIGTGIKYYFWTSAAGLRVRDSAFGVGYFSIFSFLAACFFAVAFSISFLSSEIFFSSILVIVLLSTFLQIAVAKWIFSDSYNEGKKDVFVVTAAVFAMTALYTIPMLSHSPELEISEVIGVVLAFLALGYVTFVFSFPAGQELLSGLAAVFFEYDFMLGVGVSLSVRMAYFVVAVAVVLMINRKISKDLFVSSKLIEK